jgi:transposase
MSEPTWIDTLPEDDGFELDVTSDGRGQLMPYAEIARELGVHVSTVQRIERNALRKLRYGLRAQAYELGSELMQAQRKADEPTDKQRAAWQRASDRHFERKQEEARNIAARRIDYAEARRAFILEELSKSLPDKAAQKMINIVRAVGGLDLFGIVRGLERRGILVATEGDL